MLSSIAECPEADHADAVPDSPVKKLTISVPQKRSLTEFVGGHGPWQFRQWLIYFFASFCTSLHLSSTFPLADPVDCRCSSASGFAEFNDTSNCQNNCSLAESVECFSPFSTFTSFRQADDKCLHAGLVISAKCIYLVGVLLSSLIILPVTKKFSRRVVALISGVILFSCVLATSWSDATANYLVLRLFTSFGMTNIYLVSVLTLLEFLGEEYRPLYALIGHVGWCIAHFLLPLIVWVTGNWKEYNIVLSSVTAAMVILSYFIPESVESCMDKGLKARAQKLIRIAAWKNGFTTADVEEFTQTHAAQKTQEDVKGDEKMKNIKRIFEILLLFLVGFSSSFLYFASLSLTDWGRGSRGNRFAMSGTTEVAAVILLLFFSPFVRPKRLWAASTALASLSFLLMYSVTSSDIVKVPRLPYLLTMFFCASSWTIALLQMLFYSLARGEGRAIVTLVAFCVGMAVASLNDLQKYENWNPKFFVVFGIPNLTLGASVAFIPDRYFDL